MIFPHAFPRVTFFRLAAVLIAGCAALFVLGAYFRGQVSANGLFTHIPLKSVPPGRPLTPSTLSPQQGPGGPILVISNSANPFTAFYAEILRNEGFNEFAVEDLSKVDAALLGKYGVVLLGEMPLTAGQAGLVNTWVRGGGNLIAMRPTQRLAGLLGIVTTGASLAEGYLAIDTQTAAGRGLVNETIQFHGSADLYQPDPGSAIAELFRDSNVPANAPAVLVKTVEEGRAAIFAYDLARSVVYTRQGNPAWTGMERDGLPPMRSDDLFYGAAKGDIKPDWVDLNKVAIPQADEQQRLLANLVLQMNLRKEPLPRFWYFPWGLKAVVIMTGDDHGHGGTVGRFRQLEAASPPGCVLDRWQCLRGTSNIFLGSIAPDEATMAVQKGFEIGLHIYTGCEDWPTELMRQPDGQMKSRMSRQNANSLYVHQLEAFRALYAGVPAPSTSRIDCITWGDFDLQPQIEAIHGIRLDTNYYYWPAKWVKNRPGMFTGSGMPMRFAKADGSAIDVYQAATQMTDESGQVYPLTVDSLLDKALGPSAFYGAFTANMHTDQVDSAGADAVLASAKARGVPVVSAVQMLTWLDGRNGSAFRDLAWTGTELRFKITAGSGAMGLQALLPMSSAEGILTGIVFQGSPVSFNRTSFAGIEYGAFSALPGTYLARYSAQ